MAEVAGPAVQVASLATAEALEFPSLLALHAELASTDLGRRRLLDLQPSASCEALRRRQRCVRDAQILLEEGRLLASFEEPLSPLLDGLRSREVSVTGAQLRRLARVLECSRQLADRVKASDLDVSGLRPVLEALPDGEPLRRRIVKTLDQRGRVRDDASPALVELRRGVHRVRDGLYRQLQETVERHQEHFSETTISLKDGRLTLLLHAGARGRVEGLVHGRSGSGRSLYFEPLSAVEGNNSLQEMIEEEAAERRRILVELIDEARGELPLLEAHFEVVAELDMLQSICQFAERSGAHLPELAEQGRLRLVEARHPLLDPGLASLREAALGQSGHTRPVVPLDLDLDRGRRILVVTGPNAGGKTVALKTVGLLALAAQCGLPIPAEPGTRIPMFGKVMAVVGDEQDLLADQSTFSARLLRLKEAWEVAEPGSLVLLDELGSGTDPEEGTALAVGLLEGLLQKDTMAILTTHLTRLAAVALEREGATCAAMEFDPDSGRPTYQLRPGAPGGSRALALARRLGLPRPWLQRAEALLGKEHRKLRDLLREVENIRQQLAASESEVRARARDLELERRRLDEELAAVGDERKRLEPRLRGELEDFRRSVTRRLHEELETIRQELKQGHRRGVVPAAVDRLFEEAPGLDDEEVEGRQPMQVGETVRHRSLGWIGRLEATHGGNAEVIVRGKRLRCALEDLVTVGENAHDKVRHAPAVRLQRSAATEEDVPGELNLLGFRVGPALEALDRYLDRALLSSRRQVRIVHGFGTGRLRTAVREHLGSHPAVSGFRPGGRDEGAGGATVVTLNKS